MKTLKPLDAASIFSNLLYKHPVYEWYKDKDKMNILVFGAWGYGQAFMDVALSMLQIKDKPLHLTVATHSPGYDKKINLKVGPDLKRFVDIDP